MSVTALSLDHWYALAVVAGQERAVRKRILERLEKAGQLTADLNIVCPEEEVVLDAGTTERRTVRKVQLQGYLLLRCRRLKPAAASNIMRVNGVMDFLGGAEAPTPLSRADVDRILKVEGEPQTVQRAKVGFDVGDRVRVLDGPLTDFEGEIIDINISAQTAQIEVEIFGRKTPAQVAVRALRKA